MTTADTLSANDAGRRGPSAPTTSGAAERTRTQDRPVTRGGAPASADERLRAAIAACAAGAVVGGQIDDAKLGADARDLANAFGLDARAAKAVYADILGAAEALAQAKRPRQGDRRRQWPPDAPPPAPADGDAPPSTDPPGPLHAALEAEVADWRHLDDPLSEAVLADGALRDHRFVAPDGGSDDTTKGLYVYADGVYRNRGVELIRAYVHGRAEEVADQIQFTVYNTLLRNGTPKAEARRLAALEAGKRRRRANEDMVGKVAYRVITERKAPADTFQDRALRYINCRNGLLDWRSGDLLPHTPDYLSATQLAVDYDATVETGRFGSFLEEVLPEAEDRALLLEWFGYCLLPTTKHQKCLLLIGEGANGKSKILDVLVGLLGAENVSTSSLQELTSDRFAPAQIVDRLANICADLAERNMVEDSGIFKKVVAGDPLTAQRKYGALFTFRPHCRLVFSANKYPQSRDTSYGYWRRWSIIPFEVQIPPERQDNALTEKLTAPTELSGILNLAVEGLRRLEERGHFLETAGTRRALHEYQAQTDSVVAFLDPEEDQCLAGEDLTTGKDALYQRYAQWCAAANRAPLSRTKFNRRLVETMPGVVERHHRDGGRFWQGVGVVGS